MKQFRRFAALLLSALLVTTILVPSALAEGNIKILLDGVAVDVGQVPPEVREGRTMIPIRPLAERLGAVVEWVQAERKILMTRAGGTVTMTLDQTTAYVDGVPTQMDVAPYLSGDRTLLPARYLAEFFGQTVAWDKDTRTVSVTEDKSAAGDSNLEAWALPMGSMRSELDFGGHPDLFGQSSRGGAINRRTPYPQDFQNRLQSDWSIENRAQLIDTVLRMTADGHNSNFLQNYAEIKAMPKTAYDAYVSNGTMDSYMLPYTIELGDKWGERGILAWDLFRMSNLVQWGYTAGYLTYPEALALLEPAALRLQETFTSWEEAYANYLDGYNWWARIDMTGRNPLTETRGSIYQTLLVEYPALFDNALFTQDIIPVPGITAEALLAEALGG